MTYSEVSEESVVLEQTEISPAHVSARIALRIEDPHYLHQRIELTFHRHFCEEDEPNIFSSPWISYIHQPGDKDVYLQRPSANGPLHN